MAEHDKEMEALAEKLEKERDRQIWALNNKLFKKRNQKLEDLQRKNDVEFTRTMLDHKKELEEMHIKVDMFLDNFAV